MESLKITNNTLLQTNRDLKQQIQNLKSERCGITIQEHNEKLGTIQSKLIQKELESHQ